MLKQFQVVADSSDFTHAQKVAMLLNDAGEALHQRDVADVSNAAAWNHELQCIREILRSMGIVI